MRAKTPEGREIDLNQDTLAGLEMRLQGPLFAPGDVGYEESRAVWNGMIDRRPAVVARCLGIADVIACVQFARENELLLCIKGGGHNIAGLATADGALMLDMSLMRGVWVDPQRKVAHGPCTCVSRSTSLSRQPAAPSGPCDHVVAARGSFADIRRTIVTAAQSGGKRCDTPGSL